MELDFDKYCIVDGSPTTVLSAPQHRSKPANRKLKANHGSDTLKLKENFAKISFSRYRSASCRHIRSRTSNQDDDKELKRGSIDQSSRQGRLLKKTDAAVERKKIEFSRGSTPATSFGIIDSLCSSDEDISVMERNRFSVMSLSEQSTASVCRNQIDLSSRDSKNHSVCPIPGKIIPTYVSDHSQSFPDPFLTSESVITSTNDGNSPRERDLVINLHKSLSAKLALPHSPSRSNGESSNVNSPTSRFSPVRKMFDPFMKSKSLRNPLSFTQKTGTEATNEVTENNSLCEKDGSPAHLHGILILEHRDGMPFFEFSVKSPEDVIVAKAWNVEKTPSWVYTFHSLHPRRRSSSNGWGFKDNNQEASIIGQMHVSCYLDTELKDTGVFYDSLVTEFVLYDISHARKSTSCRENSSCSHDSSRDSCERNEMSAKAKSKGQVEHSRDGGHSKPSGLHPLSTGELHPNLEIASIVMQIPFEKRESLKFTSGDGKKDKLAPNLLDNHQRQKISDNLSPGKMHVVIPAGNHSLPSTDESRGPAPLLDRWRSGGRCDCGGWDMACPLNVIGNPNIQIALGHPFLQNHHPAELFVQGRKDNVPAFAMRIIEDGKYAVDFHAQSSSLQAFSICVSILHAAEASTAVGQETSKQRLQSDSLRAFAKEEIKSLINSIAEKEKVRANKKMEEIVPSFILNPPFSPIARV